MTLFELPIAILLMLESAVLLVVELGPWPVPRLTT